MGKRYGEPYDPAIRKSDHGSRLYNMWKHLRRYPYCEEWDRFPAFYNWAMQNGFIIGTRLQRIDDSQPYGPDNCEWYVPRKMTDDPAVSQKWADEWNKTVNRIRKHYGMPPLEGTEYGD